MKQLKNVKSYKEVAETSKKLQNSSTKNFLPKFNDSV